MRNDTGVHIAEANDPAKPLWWRVVYRNTVGMTLTIYDFLSSPHTAAGMAMRENLQCCA
jgi:hypothetical protein